jgi:hypothetical protein
MKDERNFKAPRNDITEQHKLCKNGASRNSIQENVARFNEASGEVS